MHKPYEYIPPKPPMWFNLFWPGILGLILGFLTATGQKELMLFYAISGSIIFVCLTFICIKIIKSDFLSSVFCAVTIFLGTFFYSGFMLSVSSVE